MAVGAVVASANAAYPQASGLTIRPTAIYTLEDGSTRLDFNLVGCQGFNGEPCRSFSLYCGRDDGDEIVLEGEFVGIGYWAMLSFVSFGQSSVRLGPRGAGTSFSLLSVQRADDLGVGTWRLRWDLKSDDRDRLFDLLSGDGPITLYVPPLTQPVHDQAIDVLRNSASGENLLAELVARCSNTPENESPAGGKR